jgi:hypothetical protein
MDGKVHTIDGNSTLKVLQDTKFTAYATDEAGNAGVSETIDFNVQVLFRLMWRHNLAAYGNSSNWRLDSSSTSEKRNQLLKHWQFVKVTFVMTFLRCKT